MNGDFMNEKMAELTLTLKDVVPNEVLAGLDAIKLMMAHEDVPFVREFLINHGLKPIAETA